MQTSIILEDNKLKQFCKELNISSDKIVITINNNKAEYYNANDDCYYKLDLEVAKKYI